MEIVNFVMRFVQNAKRNIVNLILHTHHHRFFYCLLFHVFVQWALLTSGGRSDLFEAEKIVTVGAVYHSGYPLRNKFVIPTELEFRHPWEVILLEVKQEI